ncbi:MAG TPA: hypothetical protein VEG32_04625 [Clostridia bacterium]|nr:hypothetical protein [Clostridia bacterium]
MKRILPIVLVVLAAVFIAAATVRTSGLGPAKTPEGAVQALFSQVKSSNWDGAYSFVATSSNTPREDFVRDLGGALGSLRTLSTLQKIETKVLNENDREAQVRANLTYSSAVGALYDTRDLKVVREDGGNWRVVWPVEKQAKVPPQVIPVNYLRWDIVTRGADDDWGAQNVDAPRVRIISMNAVEKDGAVIVMGEIANEDTVPGFVSVGATLVGKDDRDLGSEESFDKITHTLLPKEISPFRIDFPGVKLSQVKSVRMQPNSMLVPASADPVVGVLHQTLDKNSLGKAVLKGELVNQSGQNVNIPHVLATFYDNSGKVIWVSDGYVDKALQPQTPVPFSVAVREDLVPQIHSYRVTVNSYSRDRREL